MIAYYIKLIETYMLAYVNYDLLLHSYVEQVTFHLHKRQMFACATVWHNITVSVMPLTVPHHSIGENVLLLYKQKSK